MWGLWEDPLDTLSRRMRAVMARLWGQLGKSIWVVPQRDNLTSVKVHKTRDQYKQCGTQAFESQSQAFVGCCSLICFAIPSGASGPHGGFQPQPRLACGSLSAVSC